MKFATSRSAAALSAAAILALTAAAQAQAPTAASGGQPLDIPQNLSFVGRPQNPNVARATAIVNEEIITRSDIEHRVALRLATHTGTVSPEQMAQLQAQVLRELIDEALQIQAARAASITIKDDRVDQEYRRVAEQFGHTPQSFDQYLRSVGGSQRSLKRQIRGNLAWQQLLRRISRVSVTDEEISDVLARLNASRGAPEYHVAEIFVSGAPEAAAEVRGQASQLVNQIRRGASFQALARQYSNASTAAVGGDLGWVRAEQLPPELAAVIQSMPVGGISDPIQVPGGFSIVAVVDSRQVLTANPRDAVLNLMQMSINMPAGTTEAQARARADELARATQSMGGCGRAPDTAKALGAELVSNDSVRVRELPPFVEQSILNMNVGQATAPFGSVERISVLVLCGREDAPVQAAPTRESVADALEEQRMQRQALRYLRDLRRDAVIDYR